MSLLTLKDLSVLINAHRLGICTWSQLRGITKKDSPLMVTAGAEVSFWKKEDMISSSPSSSPGPRFVFTLFPAELPVKRLFKFEIKLLLAHQSLPPALF